jgi:hypothetical protein
LKSEIVKAAMDTFGEQPKLNRPEWFDEDCKSSINVKNLAHKNYLGDLSETCITELMKR